MPPAIISRTCIQPEQIDPVKLVVCLAHLLDFLHRIGRRIAVLFGEVKELHHGPTEVVAGLAGKLLSLVIPGLGLQAAQPVVDIARGDAKNQAGKTLAESLQPQFRVADLILRFFIVAQRFKQFGDNLRNVLLLRDRSSKLFIKIHGGGQRDQAEPLFQISHFMRDPSQRQPVLK